MGAFSEDGAALVWRGGHETVRIEPWGPDSVRVRGTLWPAVSDDLPGALLAAPPPSGARTEIAAGRRLAQSTARLPPRSPRKAGSGSPAPRDGAVLLAEVVPHFTGPPQRRYAPTGDGTGLHRIEVLFAARDGERCYGLGQHQHGRLDQKGAVVELVQRNTEVTIPFLVSSRGLRVPVEPPGDRPGRAGHHRHPLGVRGVPPVGLLGHRRATGPRTSCAGTRRHRAGARCCRSGRRGSGSASCGTGTRTSCSTWPASTSGAACRCRSSSSTTSTGPGRATGGSTRRNGRTRAAWSPSSTGWA